MGERLASPLGSGELGERLITPPLISGDSGDENRGQLLGLPISACGDRAGSGDDCSGEDPEGESDSSEFSPEEWARAQAKLVEAERRTGLTFLQRAKLRRQLLAGGVVDVPIFQQRYGPLPSWMTRGNEASSSSDPVMDSGAAGLASVFTVCGGVILALIGSPAAEWSRVSQLW